MVNIPTLESMVVGPIFDSDGICRGAVQFVNHISDDGVITAD